MLVILLQLPDCFSLVITPFLSSAIPSESNNHGAFN
jgi:hypothetical protein